MSTITLKTVPANRKELAQAFGQNQSAVRRIESLTQDITVTLPDAIDGSNIFAAMALNAYTNVPARGMRSDQMRFDACAPLPPPRLSSDGILARIAADAFVAQQPGIYDTVSDALARFASPPTIGGTTPGAATFTELAANGNDALLYQNSSGQSIPGNASTQVSGWTKAFDRLNTNFNAATGAFTAPVAGYYHVDGQITYGLDAPAVAVPYLLILVANGVAVATGAFFSEATGNTYRAVRVGAVIYLAAGQTAYLQAYQNSGAAVSLLANASYNYLSICRIP